MTLHPTSWVESTELTALAVWPSALGLAMWTVWVEYEMVNEGLVNEGLVNEGLFINSEPDPKGPPSRGPRQVRLG